MKESDDKVVQEAVEVFEDILGEEIKHWAMNPEFVRALIEARDKMDRATFVLCPWRTCEYAIDPDDGTILSSVGLVGCACDYLPGWKSKWYAGLPKPGFAAKATGRHGSRVARKRRLEKEHRDYVNGNLKSYVGLR